MSTKMCSIANVVPVLNIESGWTRDNDIINLYIEQATALIRQYTRREWDYGQHIDFASTTDIDTAIRRGSNTYTVTLREKNLDTTMPFSIRYDAAGKFDDAADVDPSIYSIDTRRNQIVFYPSLMRSADRNIRISYYAGFKVIEPDDPQNIPADFEADILDVPANLRLACVAQTAYFVRQYYNSVTGTTRKDSQARVKEAGLTGAGLVAEALALIKSETRLLMGKNG